MRRLIPLAFLLLAACSPNSEASQTGLTLEPIIFEAKDGTRVEAERGTFEVPERRADPNSRRIKLSFVRFKSTAAQPGAPIVYLAGGPGGSGAETAKGPRYPVFMALRAIGDVIAFDQRGTGASNDIPRCEPEKSITPDVPAVRANLIAYFREGLTGCFAWWRDKGIDIDGYTTRESADDIAELRRVLGAEKLTLWGISYGSHLALAVMKYHPDIVDRAVLAGIEGLDQTVKRPALTDEVFARLQTLIDTDPKAKAIYGDLAATMRRVVAKLNASPAQASYTPKETGVPITLTFDGYALQLLTASSIADPAGLAKVPLNVLAMDNGMYDLVAPAIWNMVYRGSGFRGMPEAMDIASGISAARLELVTREAKTSLLSDALNFPMPQLAGIRPELDAGDAFRAPFQSDIPVLYISGTLDGRTYPEEARAEFGGFPNAQQLVVENGGHNIYEADPRIRDAVVDYLAGRPVPATIRFDPPVIEMPPA